MAKEDYKAVIEGELTLVNKTAIKRAISKIESHHQVEKVSNVVADSNTKDVDVTVNIKLNLPFNWLSQGKSPNGVFSIEPVTFTFPSTYPINAPTIKLRDDFDTSLAHIQPRIDQGAIIPCIYAGDLDELMQSGGLTVIINQVISWLEKAALKQLIDPDQGWEPIRRDTLKNRVIADCDFLRNFVSSQEKHFFLTFDFLGIESPSSEGNLDNFSTYGIIGSQQIKSKDLKVTSLEYQKFDNNVFKGKSLAILVTPGRLTSSGEPIVYDKYQPEYVKHLYELSNKANEYGCINELTNGLRNLQRYLNNLHLPNNLPLAIILCVRRPYNLIGETSNIELIPYIIYIDRPDQLNLGSRTSVFPACHQQSITPQILQKLSGKLLHSESNSTILLGCGSLGSKIALHLARSGNAPNKVIDRKYLSPHNAARHALCPISSNQLVWIDNKAASLAYAIKGLGQCCKGFTEDITKIISDKKLFHKIIPNNSWGIINSTASHSVREALTSKNIKRLKTRIIEASLFSKGLIGTLTVEGPHRNPNSSDLIVSLYEHLRQDDVMQSIFYGKENILQEISIGQGCSSITMVVSDAKISLFAASMSEAISKYQNEGLPTSTGEILLGQLTENNLGLKWRSINIPPVHIIPTTNDPTWTVRLSEYAHSKIVNESMSYPDVETGGILMGRISECQQSFLVANVLSAPPDSVRSQSEFILGTHGLNKQIQEYMSACNSTLYCLGTWHSHLGNSHPSSTDLNTASILANSNDDPLIMLIRSPKGYSAILADRSN